MFGTSVEPEGSKYVWFGTDLVFDAFTFIFKETEHGLFNVHAYPYDEQESTFIVEMRTDIWRRLGFERFVDSAQQPGESDWESIALLGEQLSGLLDGQRLLGNNSKWRVNLD